MPKNRLDSQYALLHVSDLYVISTTFIRGTK